MIWLIAYLSSVGGAVLTVLALTIMRNEQRRNVGRLGWLGLIILSPPVAWLLLIWLGGRRISAEHRGREHVRLPEPRGDDLAACGGDDGGRVASRLLPQLLIARGLPPPSSDNRVKLLGDSDSFRDGVLEVIDNAAVSIHVTTYLFGRGPAVEQVVDRLVAARTRGVRVRLLIDAVGSFFASTEMLDRLRAADVMVERFKPLTRWSKFAYLDYRNHRKLMVIDGRVAILGGGNLTQPELGEPIDSRRWVDLSLQLTGSVVDQMAAVFRSDWKFVTGEALPVEQSKDLTWEPPTPANSESDADAGSTLSLIPIGPDGPRELLEDFWLLALALARRRVWICSPYFVPAPSVMRMLELICRRDIELRILIPDKSDLVPVDYAREDYLRRLEQLGAMVLRYPEEMVHAKVGVIDDDCLVGSANFDLRSFFLNYELAVAAFDDSTTRRVVDWFQTVAEQCKPGMRPATRWRSAVGTIARVAAAEL